MEYTLLFKKKSNVNNVWNGVLAVACQVLLLLYLLNTSDGQMHQICWRYHQPSFVDIKIGRFGSSFFGQGGNPPSPVVVAAAW